MKNKSLLMTIAILFIAMNSHAQVTDKNGNTYKTVKIRTQEWMAENLYVSHFRNGDLIPEAKTTEEWQKAANEGKPVWCYYNSDPANANKYGKLYNWFVFNDPRGLAPYGWHVPSTLEWAALTDYLGGEDAAGGKMKATNGWDDNGNGTNESGFAGLPGGYRTNDGSFKYIGMFGYWWSSSESSITDAWYRVLNDGDGSINGGDDGKGDGLSVRCIKN